MNEKKLDQILYITSEPFPDGMAGTNRIISLCKGFLTNKLNVEVLTLFKFRKQNETDKNPGSGTFEGIQYSHLFNTTVKSRSKFVRTFEELSKYFMIIAFCLRKVRRSTLIIYYSSDTLSAITVRIISKIRGALFLKEETEHPLVRIADMQKREMTKSFFMHFHYGNFDGLFVITGHLYKYFKEEFKFRKPVIIIPMVVDVNRFKHRTDSRTRNIVFSGELDNKKEGVDILIRAFSLVNRVHPDFRLNLYGKANDEVTESNIRRMISELGLGENVFLHGYKNRGEMTEILENADFFVFTRPVSLQATYGFSTKLGEYLAAGKPVLATKVGEFEKYLHHRKNAFLCDCNENSISETMREIIEDQDFAKKVGNMGRVCALEYFNNISETKKAMEQVSLLFHRDFIQNRTDLNQ